ncbi:MAG: phospholipid scramblase-related protein [Planctomycetaceae bacterium]
MHPALNRNLYFIKEHVGMFKASNSYDVLDPETGEEILHCREPNLGFFTKMFRFTKYKRMTPFDVHVTTPEGDPVIRITRGVSIFLSKVDVLDENDEQVGGFKQKFFSIGGAFNVLDDNDEILCTLKGKWTGWEFKFEKDGVQYAMVTKKWAGLGKELFTSADNYVLEISDEVPQDHPLRMLIMGAIFCIDMVLKE